MTQENTDIKSEVADLPLVSAMPDTTDPQETDDDELYLIMAWQALAMYVATAEEPELIAAGMKVLSSLRDLIAQEDATPEDESKAGSLPIVVGEPMESSKEPLPTGYPSYKSGGEKPPAGVNDTIIKGVTKKRSKQKLPSVKKDSAMLDCAFCDRSFGTDIGFLGHTRTIHKGMK